MLDATVGAHHRFGGVQVFAKPARCGDVNRDATPRLPYRRRKAKLTRGRQPEVETLASRVVGVDDENVTPAHARVQHAHPRADERARLLAAGGEPCRARDARESLAQVVDRCGSQLVGRAGRVRMGIDVRL